MIAHRRFTMALYLMALVVLVDQLTKWWAMGQVIQPPHYVIVNSFFNLVLVWNKGITFGLFSKFDHMYVSYFLIVVAAVIIGLLGRWLWRTSSMKVSFGLAMVMGGAIGNVIDRVRYGAVFDFLDFYYRDYHWYAFNIADAAIVVGVGLLLLDSLVRGR
ncbi:MAG: signal peptidase II [Alphaproteobacteria bacterium]